MMVDGLYLERKGQRARRWLGAGLLAVGLHAGAGFSALWWLREDAAESERRGAVMLDLVDLAAESPSDQVSLSKEPLFQQAAPPPQPRDDPDESPPPEAAPAKEAPAEPQEVAKAEPVPVPPETAEPRQESAPQPEEMPKIEAAPLAPTPEVALPEVKPVERAPADPPKQTKPEAAEKTKQAAEPAKSDRQRAQKSDSQVRREAAASARGVFDPNPIYRANPEYPAAARSSRIEGVVVVGYSVSASGAVTNVSIISASPPGVFNGVTIAAVSRWRFKPPGQAVHGRRTTIRFKLR